MKKLTALAAAALLTTSLTVSASACGLGHTVVQRDALWKLAVKYQIGTCKVISANPQITNPNLTYPEQTPSIPQGSDTVNRYENEVIRLVNEIRTENGLKPLTANQELSQIARYKSEDMSNNRYFSHTSPTYGTPFQMMQAFGISYRSAGENIAYGQKTPAAVVNAWMNSSGHRANILKESYTQIGVGYCASGNYWTQMFIG